MYSDESVAELMANADHDPDAMFQIGVHYFEGTGGVEKDFNKAAEYFRKAAEHNHADAQFCLSLCYCSGLGVPKDAIESVSWHFRAAARGSEGARKLLYETAPSLFASVTHGEDRLREILSDLKMLKKLAELDRSGILEKLRELDRSGILEKLRELLKDDNLEDPKEENG